MRAYSISQLARLAGVSVRMLHHYDQIGLLRPSARTAAGYRLYEEQDLLRLQQILFFKELDLPLGEIGRILDDPGFDQLRALEQHRQLLQQRMVRLTRLLNTIDRTIIKLTEDSMALSDEELYEGFAKEQIERYQREAREMYDPALVAEAERRVRRMSKEQWQALKAEGDEVTRGLAALADRDPSDPEVQALIARHYAWLEHFYTPTAEVYRGLGRLYVEHPEFRATYDRYRPGLAAFMCAAMAYYADTVLASK
ncbi:MAG TPA: MerR family transcriptional regulator [Anaerolineae bacterium]|nr:MerR family transcriptional regulator [Anaerolineae bacterium]HOQ97995.1 MerR family transcriptional regulator [Anaerolineae bacterium]HPL26688.1 MerR family transcriptional regulator [Anaerolineae bacterium]